MSDKIGQSKSWKAHQSYAGLSSSNPKPYPTEIVHKVVLQNSIPAQIRQLILHISSYKNQFTDLCGIELLQNKTLYTLSARCNPRPEKRNTNPHTLNLDPGSRLSRRRSGSSLRSARKTKTTLFSKSSSGAHKLQHIS